MPSISSSICPSIHNKSTRIVKEIGSANGDVLMPRIKDPNEEKATLFKIGDSLRNRWTLQGLLGKGGYGEIYYAIDGQSGDEIAVKVEPQVKKGRLAKRIILEQKVLLRLQGRPHTPKLIASGSEGTLNFVVMQLLSTNVGDLRKQSPCRFLSRSTVSRLSQQSLAALRDLHSIGYVHRDVKPPNMCFGVTANSRHCLYLLDFGLVRRFINEDGTMRAPRIKAGFRGTFRYVSVGVHNRQEQSPLDDVISLFYSAVELLTGKLPWKNTRDYDVMRFEKENLHETECEAVAASIGEDFREFGKLLMSLAPSSTIDYTAMQALLQPSTGGRLLTDPYDWDENYATLKGL